MNEPSLIPFKIVLAAFRSIKHKCFDLEQAYLLLIHTLLSSRVSTSFCAHPLPPSLLYLARLLSLLTTQSLEQWHLQPSFPMIQPLPGGFLYLQLCF